MQINFQKGLVLAFADLLPKHIALDGFVQGPELDPAMRRFSFDHHSGCLRLVTKATCEQVREAIILGLPIDDETVIDINDIDGDTVLSVWLLQNPTRVWEKRVEEVVAQVGKTDAHGPIFGRHPLQWLITPPWGKDAEPQSIAMLERFLAVVTQYMDGVLELANKERIEEARGFGWSARTGWQKVETKTGFDGFYKQGFTLGFLYQEAPGGTVTYTVAKASDLVAARLGPGSKTRPVTDVSQFEDTVLGALGRLEQEKNPTQSLAHTWGGGTSIGGGPRNADGTASRLTPEEVLAVFKRFTVDR